MMPAVNHARTIAQLCELLSDSVSLKAMTLPTMVSVALTRGIARRVFWPTTAEKLPSKGNAQFAAFASHDTGSEVAVTLAQPWPSTSDLDRSLERDLRKVQASSGWVLGRSGSSREPTFLCACVRLLVSFHYFYNIELLL